MEYIHIQQWDEDKFLRSKKEWNELLKRSSSDRLFLSWEWQSCWWKIFSDPENMELKLYVATNSGGKLVGLAPLFATTITTKNIFNSRRIQFIGNVWRGKPTMLTELLDFIVDKEQSKEVIRALYAHINKQKFWDELVITFLDIQSDTYRLLIDEKLLPGCYLRHAEKYKSYYLNTKGDYQTYVRNLGKNTRLKLHNRRKHFGDLGKISFERMLSDNIDENFNLLNSLHEKRWGRPVFSGKLLEFNKCVANLMAENNNLNFSILSLNNEPVSIQFNYVINHHNYNIQAGFNESFHKKISLGYLHFGYEIEASFNHKYTAYELLAGEGKYTQYKERLTDTCLHMTDLQIIRSTPHKALYKIYDLFKKPLKNTTNYG